jgi:Dolichyl-phosphate-mannose-protein mannosyltransferase
VQINQTRWANLLLFISVLFGAILRFAPTIISRLPINDGGMFYVMIQDLKSNHFLIPAFTSYNHVNIPFAYPPLSFYVGGLLFSLGIPLLEIFHWIPPFVSTVSILAFYWAANLMLDSKTKAVLATMAYALMPRSFSWYVMGGGLSRTFGVLFLLLTCGSTWALFTKNEQKYIFPAMLFGAGAVLSHPETGLHTAAACVIIWLFNGRSKKSSWNALLVGLGVFILISPWWGTVLAQHGFTPFLSVLHTGGNDSLFWIPWVTFDFGEERFVTLLTVLGLIGIVVQSLRREWFLVAWLLASFVVEPRSAPAIAAIPLAMLAGIGLSDFVLPKIGNIISNTYEGKRDWTFYMASSPVIRIVLGYVLFSALIGGFFYDISLAQYVVPLTSRDAMVWVQNNTPPNSRFIVLTGNSGPFSDPVVEWFPAFTSRTSQNTIQGKEWLLGPGFTPFLDQVKLLQSCLNDTPSCVENWANTNHLAFDYIYIEKSADRSIPGLLLHELQQDPEYDQIYSNEAVVIFERK